MKHEAHETVEETLSMPKRVFIDRCLAWIKEFNNGKRIKVEKPADCPLSQWAVHNDAKCRHEMVGGTAVCPICGNPMCPDCGNHGVDVLSRVTGYLSHETVEETLSMPKRVFIDRCLAWIKEFNNGKRIKVEKPADCPLSQWVVFNDAKCHRELVAGTAMCPICGNPMCPDCGNHNVDVISRVTGYLSTVSGWNESKKQEFEERNRYELTVAGGIRGDVNR